MIDSTPAIAITSEEQQPPEQKLLVILDKDGTLTKPKQTHSIFVQDPYDQEPLPGAVERVGELLAMGADLIICSNQGGIAAKKKTLDMAIVEMKYCFSLFQPDAIKRAYFCPDFGGKDCWVVQPGELQWLDDPFTLAPGYVPNTYRKPAPGMIQAAIRFTQETHPNQQLRVIAVGDRMEDEHAAGAAGVEFVHAERWLKNGLTSCNGFQF